MRRRFLPGLAATVLALAACSPAPTPSPVADACSDDLPPRTSPTDFPVAVLHVAGDDLPPVVGEVEWLGGAAPVQASPPLPLHLERFTVLQIRGRSQFSIRMTDAVAIAAWTVEAIPSGTFRSGDLETGRVGWSEGADTTETICVPVEDGSWVIVADITFADDAGTGIYYWRLNASETPG